jgi:hypothetical protein
MYRMLARPLLQRLGGLIRFSGFEKFVRTPKKGPSQPENGGGSNPEPDQGNKY